MTILRYTGMIDPNVQFVKRRFGGFTVTTLVGSYHLHLQWTISVIVAILSTGHAHHLRYAPQSFQA